MKSLYLILAATAVVVTCEPQRTNNDIIWYPVDDEDGVFISTVGEKRRTPQDYKWRSQRRARHSGPGFPLPLTLSQYDPTENHDPSFFHNIRDRQSSESIQPIPKVPPAFLNEQFPVDGPNRFQPQGNQNSDDGNYQQIYNEVFNYGQPSYNGFPQGNNQWGGRPITENQIQWGDGRPNFQNQWGNVNRRPVNSNQNQWAGGRPDFQNQWGNQAQRPATNNQNQWAGGRPNFQNQWGNQGQRPVTNNQNQWAGNAFQRPGSGFAGQWGGSNSRPVENPNNAEWLNTNRPSKRPDDESDKLVFPGEISGTTTPPPDNLPTDPPTMSPCERTCPVTPEFNPVCGSDGVTYTNAGRLKCARACGKNVRLAHHGNCGRTPLVTPLLPNNPIRQSVARFFLAK